MDSYKELSSELSDDNSNEEFNKYLERIRMHYKDAGEVDLDIYEMSTDNPAIVVGSMVHTRDGFMSKSASTVEADIRELFGYRQIIKPMRVRRRKPKKVSKAPKKISRKSKAKPKAASKAKSKAGKKGKRGGNESEQSLESELIDDFEVASSIQEMESDNDTVLIGDKSECGEDKESAHVDNIDASNGASNGTSIICTLVMCGDKYVPGALVLAQSVHKKTSVPIWCMYTSDVSLAAVAVLEEYFDRCIEVPMIEHDVIEMRSKKQQDIYGSWISKSFTKWNIFNPELFPGVSQVLFMDADMLLLEDISDVFKLCEDSCDVAATFSSPWTKPFAPHGENPYYHNRSLDHGESVNHDDIKKGLENSICAIASMVLVRPNKNVYNGMMDILAAKEPYGTNSVSSFDEQMLAQLILKYNLRAKNIHQSYNWLTGKDSWLEGKAPKTYHYYNVKPWQRQPEYDDEKLWHEYAAEIVSKGDPLIAQWFM
jgi:lipopolysaccharide biosynthesis glycosyltransferase